MEKRREFSWVKAFRKKYDKDPIISIDDITPRWGSKRIDPGTGDPGRLSQAEVQDKGRPGSRNHHHINADIREIKRFHQAFLEKGVEGLVPKFCNTGRV